MQTIQLEVDANLAKEYRQKYQERFRQDKTAELDDSNFLRVFLEDRLREELGFLNSESE